MNVHYILLTTLCLRKVLFFKKHRFWYQKDINLPTSPLYSGCTTFSTILFICASEYLGYHWTKRITTVTMHLTVSLYYNKCLTCLLFAWTQLLSLLRPCSIASSTTLCRNSVYVSTSRCCNSTSSSSGAWYTVHISRHTYSNPQDLSQHWCLATYQDW